MLIGKEVIVSLPIRGVLSWKHWCSLPRRHDHFPVLVMFLKCKSGELRRFYIYRQLHPVVLPHVSHFMQVPLRTSVKLPHSPQASPS